MRQDEGIVKRPTLQIDVSVFRREVVQGRREAFGLILETSMTVDLAFCNSLRLWRNSACQPASFGYSPVASSQICSYSIMILQSSFLSTLAVLPAASAAAVETKQQLLADMPTHRTGREHVLYELKIAEIIPTVLDPFEPRYLLEFVWPSGVSATLGNTEWPYLIQHPPTTIALTDPPSSTSAHKDSRNGDTETRIETARHVDLLAKNPPPGKYACTNLVIALTDPDAPGRDNPVWSEVCHYILYCNRDRVGEIVEWKSPGPPPWTGKHRYVAVAMMPRNGTADLLDLRAPKERQHWGYGKERFGLKRWAEEHGLEVVAANFVYSQDAIQ